MFENPVGVLLNRLVGLGRKPTTPYTSFYDLEALDLDGQPVNFAKFRGKVRRRQSM